MGFARVALLALFMVLLSSVAMAADHIVGDDKGWIPNYDYSQWTKDKVFRVGDNLVFNYDNTKHNVFKVNGTGFQNCIVPPENEVIGTTGKDVIPLKTDGKKWYICGKADHCVNKQMKLVINVEVAGPAPAPSSAPNSLLSSLSGVLVAATVAVAAIFA